MLKQIGSGLCILFLAACSGGGAAPAPTAAALSGNLSATAVQSTPDATKNSTVEITGAVSQSFQSNGVYTCTDPTAIIPGNLTLSFMGQTAQALIINLPTNALPGTYEFIDGATLPEGNKAAGKITLGAGDVYFSQSGTITLDELGSGPNQPVTGTFEFTAAALADTNKIVTVKGTFDFVTIGEAGAGGDLSQFYCGDK